MVWDFVYARRLLSNGTYRPIHDAVLGFEHCVVAKARRILDAPPRYLKTDCLLTQRLPKRNGTWTVTFRLPSVPLSPPGPFKSCSSSMPVASSPAANPALGPRLVVAREAKGEGRLESSNPPKATR